MKFGSKYAESTADSVVEFFKSWGMYPNSEDTDDLNTEVIRDGINRCCYFKLLEEAKKHIRHSDASNPNFFAEFCSRIIDAVDDSFYLDCETWGEVKEAWIDYVLALSQNSPTRIP